MSKSSSGSLSDMLGRMADAREDTDGTDHDAVAHDAMSLDKVAKDEEPDVGAGSDATAEVVFDDTDGSAGASPDGGPASAPPQSSAFPTPAVTTAGRASASSRSTASPRTGQARRGGRPAASGGMKGLAAPVLATVGLLLLIPAVWGAMLLAGMEVWSSDRKDARMMALVMQVCWPLSLCLLGSAVWCLKLMAAEKDRQGGLRR